MTAYVSPQVAAGAASTRTPSDVLAARKPTVRSFGNPIADLAAQLMGFEPVVVDRPTLKSCPCCGMSPNIDPAFHGKVCVYCDNDDCPQSFNDGWPQAMGDTLELAAKNWNEMEGRI